MATARKGNNIKPKLNLLLYGEQFTGKTTLALQAALLKRPDGKNFRVLLFDCESGGADESIESVVSQGANPDDIFVLYTQSISEIKEYIRKIANHETLYMLDDEGNETDEEVFDSDGEPFYPDIVIVDGTSVLKMTAQDSMVNLSQKRNKIKAEKNNATADEKFVAVAGASLEIRDYQLIQNLSQNFVLSLMSLPCSVILTSREKEETKSIKDSEGKIASVAIGRKIPDSLKGIEYNCKQIFRMYKDPDTDEICAYVEKDRTKVHELGEVLVNPSLLDYQVMFDKTADRKAFNVQNNFEKAIETEQKIMEKEILGEDTTENVPTDAASLIAEINAIIKKMNVADKKSARAEIKRQGYPDDFRTIEDVDVLKGIKEIVSQF